MNKTFINAEDGIAATVTKVSEKWIVCLLDIDADDGIVDTRRFNNRKEAILFALSFIDGVKL